MLSINLNSSKADKLKGIQIFAFIELSIGGLTLASNLIALILHTSRKPFNVLLFVILASLISILIGTGLLHRKRLSLTLLLYFAFSIILSKILIAANIISLSGALETGVPAPVKNALSLIYHSLVIWYFNQKQVKSEFN